MRNELERIWKESFVSLIEVLLPYFLERLRVTMKNFWIADFHI
jgi:hypothetical protein